MYRADDSVECALLSVEDAEAGHLPCIRSVYPLQEEDFVPLRVEDDGRYLEWLPGPWVQQVQR